MSEQKKYFPIQTETSCKLKWSWSSLYLNTGITGSCWRTSLSELTPENFNNFHNTESKIDDRQSMLHGHWPESNCGYCKDIERAGGVSDRLVHMRIPDPVPPELELDLTSTKVTPTMLEVFFNNTCNLSCIYCFPSISSSIDEENRKFGIFNSHGVRIEPAEQRKYRDLVPYFWNWFKDNFISLRRLNIAGGEPFYQKDFNTLIDLIDQYPNKECELSTVSNLMIPNKRLVEYVEKIKKLVANRKIKRFDLSVSLDCLGPQQEYVRYGLDIQQWMENFEYLMQQRWIKLNINQTISGLTIKTAPELVEKIVAWKKIRPLGYYAMGIAPGPSYMKATIFGPGVFDQDFKNILELLPETTDEEKTTKDQIRGIDLAIQRSSSDLDEITKLIVYLNEKDRRRNTNWKELFPWLVKYEELCGIAK